MVSSVDVSYYYSVPWNKMLSVLKELIIWGGGGRLANFLEIIYLCNKCLLIACCGPSFGWRAGNAAVGPDRQ